MCEEERLSLLPAEPVQRPSLLVLGPFRLPLSETEYMFDKVMAPVYDADLLGADSIAETLPYLIQTPFMVQSGRNNPLVIALDQVEAYNEDDAVFLRRLAEAAFYGWQNRGSRFAGADAVRTLFKEERIVARDAVLNVVGAVVGRRLKSFVGRAQTEGDQIALDIGVHTITSFDSVSSIENLILTAGRRNIGAIVIADHDRLDGVRRAQRVVERLKRKGKIREDFVVIPGQEITTSEGHIFGLFLKDRVLQGMTAKQTIREIHRQGGLAILADPAAAEGVKLARSLPFDGYVIRPGIRRLFRTLQLQRYPSLAGKPFFYTTQTHFKDIIEGVYVVVDTPDHTCEGLKRAILEGNVWAAGNAYFPVIAILGFRPITKYENFLNQLFTAREDFERVLQRMTGADNITFRVTWWREFARLMDFDVTGVLRPASGQRSALTDYPRIRSIFVVYGPIVFGYDRDPETVSVAAAFAF
ncbi:MAG: PHP domain-containing protein [Armatimonadota bacterium]